MKRSIARLLVATVAALSLLTSFGGAAFAQAGHFVGEPVCTDQGTTVECRGKVAGLGGTTFEITVEAQGTASVECTDPGGNVAPGKSITTTVAGTSGPSQRRATASSGSPWRRSPPRRHPARVRT